VSGTRVSENRVLFPACIDYPKMQALLPRQTLAEMRGWNWGDGALRGCEAASLALQRGQRRLSFKFAFAEACFEEQPIRLILK
jgi:hypothetical protein